MDRANSQSPAAFYVFSTIKVIWVPAVVDNTNGQVSCRTTSTDQVCCRQDLKTTGIGAAQCPTASPLATQTSDDGRTQVFSNVNKYVEAYFDGRPAHTVYEPRPWYLDRGRPPTVASTYTNPTPYKSATISFPTPFVYLPRAGALERPANIVIRPQGPCGTSLNDSQLGCSPDQVIVDSSNNQNAAIPYNATFEYVAENYGHVPQALLDWMLKDPLYVAQFPDIASCGPGGPQIKLILECAATAPVRQEPVPALTVGTENVVDVAGCFRPGACPTISTPNNQAGTPAIESAQVTADPLQLGDSGTKTLEQTFPISQNGVASSAPTTSIIPSQAVSEPTGETSEPPRTSLADDVAISVNQIATPEDTPQQQTPVVDPQGVGVGSITSIPNLDDQNVIGSLSPAPGSSTIGIDDSTYSSVVVTGPLISNGSPSLLGQATLLSGAIPNLPTSPPLSQEWKAPPLDQVSSNSQASFGGMSGPPVETLSDEQTPALPNDWATAEVQPQSVNASLGSGTPLLNEKPATPGDEANENWQADVASLIMKAFGSAPGSAVSNGASPEAGTQPSPTKILPSSESGILDSAVPIEQTSLDNDAVINSLSLQSSFLTNAESIGSPVIIAGNTIQPGSSVTISGTTYALPSSSTGILVNGSPSPLPPPFDPAKSRPSASDDVALASVPASSYSIIPGAPGIIISGTTYSRPATGTEIFINGSPSAIPSNILGPSVSQSSPPQIQQPSPPKGSPLPSNLPDTARSQSALIIASQTLQPAQAITISGNIISLPPTGINQIVVDGQTQSISLFVAAGSRMPSGIVFTDAKGSFTASLTEATSPDSTKKTAETTTSGEVVNESGTTNGSGVEGAETRDPASEGPPNGTASEGSRVESLAVRMANRNSRTEVYMFGFGILLAIVIEI
ncbi:MAG: hypothetical protein Q9176_005993 [Flavoplaca citrina]